MAHWIPHDQGETLGELGVIMKDEEWPHPGRITLEMTQMRPTVTCVLYGTLMHTSFTSPDDGEARDAAMKTALNESSDDAESLMALL